MTTRDPLPLPLSRPATQARVSLSDVLAFAVVTLN